MSDQKAPARNRSLEKEREELLAKLADLDTRIAEEKTNRTRPLGVEHNQTASRPVRLLLLDSLDDFQSIAFTRELAIYCRARYDRDIPSTRFGTVADDEVKSYFKGKRPRTVWLCFALTADRAEPIKRVFGRSDWPLVERIVAPTTGRVQHLKITARLCELAERENASDPDVMRNFAADHARDLPGVQMRRGEFELAKWREVANLELSRIQQRDLELRSEAAEKWLQRLPEAQQLFGAFEAIQGEGEGTFAARNSS